MEQRILDELSKIKRKGIGELKVYLKSNGFFTALCSLKYHLNREGGLAQHSWNVYQLLKEKNKRYNLNLSEETMIITGLLHDICKIKQYVQNAHRQYVYSNDFPIGHGEKSVILIQRFMQLTKQEVIMIRWHMSVYDVSETGKKDYYQAIKLYPECFALYTADHEATIFIENE